MIVNETRIMEKLADVTVDENKYRIITDEQGVLNVLYTGDDGREWFIHNHDEAEKLTQEFIGNDYTGKSDAVVLGFGLGYHIKTLARTLNSGGGMLYIFETNLVLLKIAFENTDIVDLLKNDNIVLYAGEDIEGLQKYYFMQLASKSAVFLRYTPALATVPDDCLRMEQYRRIYVLKTDFRAPKMTVEDVKRNLYSHYRPAPLKRKYRVIVLDNDIIKNRSSIEWSFIENIILAFKYIGCETVFLPMKDVEDALVKADVNDPVLANIVLCDFFVTLHFSWYNSPVYDLLKIPFISIILDRLYITDHFIRYNHVRHAIYAWSDKSDLRYAGLYYDKGIHRFLPHCAELNYESDDIFKRERCIDVVIICNGFYFQNFTEILNQYLKSEHNKTNFISRLFEYYKNEGKNRIMEDCIKDILGWPDGTESDKALYQLMLNEQLLRFCCEINARVKHIKRLKLVQALLDNGITIHLFGGGWEDTGVTEHPNCVYHGVISGEASRAVLECSKILINIMPHYSLESAHDRIFSSMSRGALCMTDATDYLREMFTEGEDIVFYDNDNLDGLAGKIRYYLAHEDERLRITVNAFENVRARHTWVNRAEDMISMYEEFKNQH
jgi:glycosyltransferase involved in cell wall biosynthesis